MFVQHSSPTPSYILNRGWIDRNARRLPTYKEITGKTKGDVRAGDDDGNTSSFGSDSDSEASGQENGVQEFVNEDEFDEVAERFETSYNFRFEEP